jgi:hypothetical protein
MMIATLPTNLSRSLCKRSFSSDARPKLSWLDLRGLGLSALERLSIEEVSCCLLLRTSDSDLRITLICNSRILSSLHSDRSLVSLSYYYAMIHYKDAGASSAFTNPLKTEYSTSINPPTVTTGSFNDNVPMQS